MTIPLCESVSQLSSRRRADLTVCGQAGSLQEAVELFEPCMPDVVLMDLRLPDGNGVQAIKHMRSKQPAIKILVLTTYEGDEDIHQAHQAGAMGYLIKGMPHESLLDAIRKGHSRKPVSSSTRHAGIVHAIAGFEN